ncbi:MAG: hypothetical protein WC721_22350 [Victivallaceae bacterium]|jgi:hypothetical protein
MKKLFTLALVVAVLSAGGVAFANDNAGAAADKSAKGLKHVDLDKMLAELQSKKDALLAKDANADTKEIDAKIEKVKAKIAKKNAKKADKKADKAVTPAAAPAPAQ